MVEQMTKQQEFLCCCKSLANIESSINILTSIGLIVEPGNVDKKQDFPNYLYESCTDMIKIAMSKLDLENISVSEENEIYNYILSSDSVNYFNRAMEVWHKYGYK